MLIVDYGNMIAPVINFGQEATNNNSVEEDIQVISPPCKNHVLMRGDTGKCVVIVQQILKRLGYYDGEITGEFDQNTEMALLDFQKAHSDWVEETGVVDADTWEILEMYAEPLEICLIETDNPNCFEEAKQIVGGNDFVVLALLGILGALLYASTRKEMRRAGEMKPGQEFIVDAIFGRK